MAFMTRVVQRMQSGAIYIAVKYHMILHTELWLRQEIDQSLKHDSDVIMSTIASQITSLTIVYSTVYSGADQRKHQSSTSLAFVRGIHRWPVNSPHKRPVTQKMFPFDDVIMTRWGRRGYAALVWQGYVSSLTSEIDFRKFPKPN